MPRGGGGNRAPNKRPPLFFANRGRGAKEGRAPRFTFTPTQPFLFIAVGPDLEASKRDAAALWLDAVQLERGDHATAYEPRQSLECFIETGATGNIFTNPATGLSVNLRAFNNTDQPQA